MKRKLCLILILSLVKINTSLFAAAPPIKDWEKCLGGSLQDIPGGLKRSNDGNILLLSNVDSHNGDVAYNHGSTDIWLTKLDPAGNILWQKSFGGSSIDVGTGISENANGNIIISGYTSSIDGDIQNNHGNFDALLICTDNSGNIIWTKTYGGTQVDLCYTHYQTKDGGYVLGGGSYSNDGDVSGNHGDQDFWVMKTDSNGNLLWQQSSGGSNIDVCYAIAEDDSGNLFASGTSNSSDGDLTNVHGNYDLWTIKYDASGNIIWNKTFGGSNYETAQTILIDSHQHILIGGYSRSSDGDLNSNDGFSDSWIIQIDANGNLISQKNLGGSGGENLYSILQTNDGGYLLTSGSTSLDDDIQNPIGQEDIWLYKTDASLSVEWNHNYGGTGNDRPVSVIQNADGGFLVAGYTFSNNVDVTGNHGSADIWLLNLACKVPAAFFSTQTAACLNDTLTFFDASTFATQGNWMVNNVSYSNGDSVTVHFTNTGLYHVTLNVQTCYYSANHSTDIMVTDCNLPVVNFSSQSNTICANSTVTMTDQSVNATAWQWTFPGGNPAVSNLQNPTVSFNQPGVYSVMLTVTNSYGSQTAMRLNYFTVNAPPAVPVISVNGNELTSSSALNYQWFYNNSPIPSETAQSYMAFLQGNYQVMVQDNNQCSSISSSVYFSETGIEETTTSTDLSVYPNPAFEKINVSVPQNHSGILNIINTNGQRLQEIRVMKNDNHQSIELSEYSKGIYTVVFIDDQGKTLQQSIIKN